MSRIGSPERPLTNGELAAYRRCRRKWWLTYHRGLKRNVDPLAVDLSSRATGSRVHLALRHHYDQHWELVDAALEGDDMAAAVYDGYVEWLEETGEDRGLEVENVEEVLEVVIERLHWRSKADLRGRLGDRWLVMDHKTVGSIKDFEATGRMQTQPLHYEAAEREARGETVRWHGAWKYNLLRRSKRTARAKPPFYGRQDVTHTDEEVDAYVRRVLFQVAEMRTLEAHLDQHPGDEHLAALPTPTGDCSWDCDFFAVCPMFDRSRESAEVVIDLGYHEGDPLAHHYE